jgi:hypothetical protein
MLMSSEKAADTYSPAHLAVQLAFLDFERHFVKGRRGYFQIRRNAMSTIVSLTGEGYDWSPRPLYGVLNTLSSGTMNVNTQRLFRGKSHDETKSFEGSLSSKDFPRNLGFRIDLSSPRGIACVAGSPSTFRM